MGVAATFAILAALFSWCPKLFGRRLNEPLGKIHFWLTFVGVYCVFMPMHWLGLISHVNIRSDSVLTAILALIGDVHPVITSALLIAVLSQGLSLFSLCWT